VAQDIIGPFCSIQGFNLAARQFPDSRLVTVVKGSRDSQAGRMLTAADAGTANVLMPVTASQAPDYLRLVNALSGGQPIYVYDFSIDPASADVTLARIQDTVQGIQTYSLGDILAQVDQIVGKLTTLLVTLASLAMLAGFITIANSVALAMLERRREVGILKAVGHTSLSVVGEVLLENGGIGFIAGALGMLLVAWKDTRVRPIEVLRYQ
jgi:ABC-type antimicrobial peptide transport system permease subunit